jgi:hypothetical protein
MPVDHLVTLQMGSILEMLTVAKQVKKFTAFCDIRRFVNKFTVACDWTLSVTTQFNFLKITPMLSYLRL